MTQDEEIDEILVDTYGEHEAAGAWEVAFGDGVATSSLAIQCHLNREGRV